MKSKILEYKPEYTNRWIVSYADFVTMLLALFMVLYAISQLDLNNIIEFSNSLNNAFNKENTQNITIKKNYDESRLSELFATTKTTVYLDEKDLIKPDLSAKKLKEQMIFYEQIIDRESAKFEEIEKNIIEKFGKEKIKVIREPRGLLIRLNDAILFDRNSDIIKNSSTKMLDEIAGIIKNRENLIRIESHTNNSPVSKEFFSSNWEFSTKRASNIIKYFIEEHKIKPERLSAFGYGERIPIANNNSKKGRAENSRIDIIILSELSKIFEPTGEN